MATERPSVAILLLKKSGGLTERDIFSTLSGAKIELWGVKIGRFWHTRSEGASLSGSEATCYSLLLIQYIRASCDPLPSCCLLALVCVACLFCDCRLRLSKAVPLRKRAFSTHVFQTAAATAKRQTREEEWKSNSVTQPF